MMYASAHSHPMPNQNLARSVIAFSRARSGGAARIVGTSGPLRRRKLICAAGLRPQVVQGVGLNSHPTIHRQPSVHDVDEAMFCSILAILRLCGARQRRAPELNRPRCSCSSNDTDLLGPSHSLATRGAIGARRSVSFRPVLSPRLAQLDSRGRRRELSNLSVQTLTSSCSASDNVSSSARTNRRNDRSAGPAGPATARESGGAAGPLDQLDRSTDLDHIAIRVLSMAGSALYASAVAPPRARRGTAGRGSARTVPTSRAARS